MFNLCRAADLAVDEATGLLVHHQIGTVARRMNYVLFSGRKGAVAFVARVQVQRIRVFLSDQPREATLIGLWQFRSDVSLTSSSRRRIADDLSLFILQEPIAILDMSQQEDWRASVKKWESEFHNQHPTGSFVAYLNEDIQVTT